MRNTRCRFLSTLLIGAVLICGLAATAPPAQAQAPAAGDGTAPMANGTAGTNALPTTDVPTFLGQVYNTLVGQGATNLDVAVGATYTPSIKQWGEFMVISRNLPIGGGVSTGIGLGLDYYNKNFYAVSGQVSLQADLTPFDNWGAFGKKVVLSPFSFVGLGTPFGSGSGGSGGGLETILAGGANLHLVKVLGGDLGLLGMYGTREGLWKASGQFYGGGLNLLWKF